MKLVALADSDSYLKWAGAFVGALPADWERELVLVQTAVAPSEAQQAAALATSGVVADKVLRFGLTELVAALRELAPDIVLIATRGPVARVLARTITAQPERVVIVTGLPGISIPATRKALAFRRQADLFVVHSKRERLEVSEVAQEYGFEQRFALGSLPFAHRLGSGDGRDLVFAAQAIVPLERADRRRVARLLLDAALADPTRRVVVKLRAVAGEHQTHAEHDSYLGLFDELARGPQGLPPNLVLSTEPMARALDTAEGLVTVSSTAAIEAIAREIPVIALDSFGVSPELINTVFEGSGLFGGEAAVISREFRHPEPAWLDANYFHDPADDDWVPQLVTLVALARRGELPVRERVVLVGGRVRLAWDRRRAFGSADRSLSGALALAIGVPLRAVVVAGRRAWRAVRGGRDDRGAGRSYLRTP